MNKKQPKYQTIFQHIQQDISNGTYHVGDMLPTERELVKQFKVSRVTTNRALQLLVSNGLIERKAGIGSFVLVDTPKLTTAPGFDASASSAPIYKIGLVLPYLSTIYGNRLLSEFEHLCTQHNFTLSIACSYARQEDEKQAIGRLIDAGLDGLIVFPVNGDYYNDALLKMHIDKFPVVLIDKNLHGIPLSCVSSNNKRAAKELTSHLIGLGHKNIGFVMPAALHTLSLIERLAGFHCALAEAQLPVSDDHVLSGVETVNVTNEIIDSRFVETLKSFLSERPQLTAIVATDDGIAQNLLDAAESLGMAVPDDLSIACFDGPAPRAKSWSFTHMVQDEIGMASKSFEILHRLMEGKNRGGAVPEHVELDASFFQGNSTSAPRKTSLIASRHVPAEK